MQPYEQLGAFYLGRPYDPATRTTRPTPLLYDAKDLTTHAVCVGMTGSGKTGLCLALLEEAAIDGIPAIAIDPKGDLGNLLLTFPDLAPADFRPWVDEAEAARKGMAPDAYAAKVADTWKSGLEAWDQDGERIRRLRAAADLAIYTPGSAAGLPLSVLRSFAAPPAALRDDADAMRERLMSAVSGLLGLVGVAADPIKSREHILLSSLLDRAWRDGRDLDLAGMIAAIQKPPFDKVGVLDLESFFPGSERFELAMRLNNLLASPGFAAWSEGEPLDVARLLWTPRGRPRISILSIAHLSEAERMFFVTLLLNEVLAWVRTQPGTSSLRAVLYMDEVYGYFPPTAEPPSKRPMLTLLKQARAFGVGCVLATQNPVDLDYKGLANTGTWFLGRLQTERDKARVLEGLEGAATASGASLDRAAMDTILSGLGNRVFLLHNVHDDAPVLFETRWVMSYLRGPLTRTQIRTLMEGRSAVAPAAPAPQAPAPAPAAAAASTVPVSTPPILPPEVPVFYAPAEAGTTPVRYRPRLLGSARLHFVNASTKVDAWDRRVLRVAVEDAVGATSPWEAADDLGGEEPRLVERAAPAAAFEELPADAMQPRSYADWGKALADHVYRTSTLTIWKCSDPKAVSEPGEDEGRFRVRVAQIAREARDVDVEKLRKRYAPRLAQIQDRIRRAEERVEREASQYSAQRTQTAISVGAGILGALFGRKIASVGNVGRATTAMRGIGRAAKEREDIGRAQQEVEAQHKALADLESEFQAEIASLRGPVDPTSIALDTVEIRPRKSDIAVERVALVWEPSR